LLSDDYSYKYVMVKCKIFPDRRVGYKTINRSGGYMAKAISIVSLVLYLTVLSGCGETVTGVVKDARRIGTGVKTVFIRDTE